MIKGTVFSIARSSLHDGDGIRTVVYFKGCSLRCQWCHNPEGLAFEPELLFRPGRCIRCGRCVKLCPDHHVVSGDEATYIRQGCTLCFRCADSCPNEALSACGRHMTAEEVFADIFKDKPYFEASGGGATFSGGECLLQPLFLLELLRLCKEGGIRTAVESAFHVPWETIESVRNLVDAFLIDIKHSDSAIHEQLTGAPNTRILQNIDRLSRSHPNITIRIPLVPGKNDNDANLIATAVLINSFGDGIQKVELLKYNNMAASKYSALGKAVESAAGEPQTDEEMEKKLSLLKAQLRRGITAVI
jgi:pyruvate formate lyase activating enzyme